MDKGKLSQLISSILQNDGHADFFLLFKEYLHSDSYDLVKHSMPPEIRRWIFSSCTEDHLYSSALIIYKLSNSDSLCDCDPSHKPYYFTLKTYKIICDECSFSDEETFKISSSNKIKQLYNKIHKNIETISLTKFEYISKINILSSSSLLIHIQNLLSLQTISSLRCCICTKVLLYGNKIGIKTSCGHYCCMYCLISKEKLLCVLCKRYFDLKHNYMRLDPNIDLTCYGSKSNHNLLLNDKKIFKFNCGHLSCENHLNSNSCFKCKFPVSEYKSNDKMTSIRDFLQVKCSSHFILMDRFDLFTCQVFCKKCDKKDESSDRKDFAISYDLGKFYLILQSFFEVCFDKLKELDVNLNKIFLKRIQYCKVLNASNLYNLVMDLSVIAGFSPISKTKKSITKFFNYSTKNSRMINIDSNQIFGFYFKVESARMLSGLIISRTAKKYQDSYQVDLDSGPVQISISSVKSSKVILDQTYSGQLFQDENEIPITPAIYLQEFESFFFKVSSSGHFLSAKPISRYKTPGLEISLIPSSENSNDHPKMHFPCFILGFIFSVLT